MASEPTLTPEQVIAYSAGREYRGRTLLDAWERELDGPNRVVAEAPIASACFEAGVLGHPLPRWVTGWRYGCIPLVGVSRNHRDDYAEAGVSLMEIDGASDQTDGTFALFNDERPRVRVGGWLIARRGSDGEPLVVGAQEL